MSTRFSTGLADEAETERRERAAALVRLISYALDEAVVMNATFLAYCLETALAAAKEDLSGLILVEPTEIVGATQPEPVEMRLSQLH